jgi:hypothetical protein
MSRQFAIITYPIILVLPNCPHQHCYTADNTTIIKWSFAELHRFSHCWRVPARPATFQQSLIESHSNRISSRLHQLLNTEEIPKNCRRLFYNRQRALGGIFTCRRLFQSPGTYILSYRYWRKFHPPLRWLCYIKTTNSYEFTILKLEH